MNATKAMARTRQVLTLIFLGTGFIGLSGSTEPGCGGGSGGGGPTPCPLYAPIACGLDCPLVPPTDADGDGCIDPPVCRCADACTASGGTLISSCPPCAYATPPCETFAPCLEQCQCPDGSVVDPTVGCTPPPPDDQRLCLATGGFWECYAVAAADPSGSGSSGGGVICPSTGCPGCFCSCPAGTAFVGGVGCEVVDRCIESGGHYESTCPACIPGEPCPLMPCWERCVCPDGSAADPSVGCPVPPPPPPTPDPQTLCHDSGGTWNDCGDSCVTLCGTCPLCAYQVVCADVMCMPRCDCPAGACWSDTAGCVTAVAL